MVTDREQAEALEAAFDASRADRPGPGEIMEILHGVRLHLGMHTAFISEFHDDRRVFRHVDSSLAEPAVRVGASDPMEDSYCARVADGRLPELLPDASLHPESAALPATAALPVGAHISVPIRFSDGRVFGTFCCYDAQPDPTLQPRDLAVMRMLADQVARFLEAERDAIRTRREARALVGQDLSGDAIIPHFQPIVRLRDGAIVGYEALARFATRPHAPFVHFEAAHQAGLGTELEIVAFEAAMAQRDACPEDAYLSVNFSPDALLDPRTALAIARHAHDRLVVELTEHVAVVDYPSLAREVARLQAAGVRVAVDDAGAGFASLSHILQLRPDIIKLDRMLVHTIADDPVRQALVQALVAFASRSHAQLVAEGIETDADLEQLRRLGVHHGQGFVIAHPSPWFGPATR